MRIRHVAPIAVMLAASACGDAGPADPGAELGEAAEAYLREALDVMEYNSVRRNEIDWPSFRAEAWAEASTIGARDPSDIHPVVISSLERLGDGHSFFRAGLGKGDEPARRGDDRPDSDLSEEKGRDGGEPGVRRIAPGVGYVEVTAFSGGGGSARDFASAYHALMEEVESEGAVCRWVVDLRGNTGGNMWPMVAAVGPILGDDLLGYFVDADSVTSSWFYEDGRSGLDGAVLVEVPAPYERTGTAPHVAVLTDRRTASSGEAVAVAFRGRAGSRSFGEPTWGVSTANAAFTLSDGSVVFLTVATMADRTGAVYGGELQPDALVDGGTKTGDEGTDRVLAAAVRWLRAQSCS